MKTCRGVLGLVFALQALAACGESHKDGSGGANGGAATTGGSTTTGGTSPSGGTSGTTGGGGGMGGGVPVNPLCDDFAEHVVAECASYPRDNARRVCQNGYGNGYPFGCGSEYDDEMRCAIDGPIDCDVGWPTGCDAENAAFLGCIVAFYNAHDGCGPPASGVPSDVTCPAGQFAFACPRTLPPSCTAENMPSIGANACCPPFPD